MRILFVVFTGLAALACVSATSSAQAQPVRAPPLAILIPGAGGAVPSDFLIRNQDAFAAAGVETRVASSASEAVALTQSERASRRRIVIVGMSRGAGQAAEAIAAGARPDGVVFVAGNFNLVANNLGSPATLPPTLIVHHRRDECRPTSPEFVAPFVRWSGGRARVRWIDTVGQPAPNPCGPFGAHGFYTRDAPAVAAIASFVRAR